MSDWSLEDAMAWLRDHECEGDGCADCQILEVYDEARARVRPSSEVVEYTALTVYRLMGGKEGNWDRETAEFRAQYRRHAAELAAQGMVPNRIERLGDEEAP